MPCVVKLDAANRPSRAIDCTLPTVCSTECCTLSWSFFACLNGFQNSTSTQVAVDDDRAVVVLGADLVDLLGRQVLAAQRAPQQLALVAGRIAGVDQRVDVVAGLLHEGLPGKVRAAQVLSLISTWPLAAS